MKEYVDIVDSNGNPIGKSAKREQAHREGLWHQTAHVWIVNSNSELLVQKRSELKETYPGKWDISAAGHCLSGDSPAQTALREAQEELGLTISASDLTLIGSVNQTYQSVDKRYIDNEVCDVFLVARDCSTDSLKLQTDEVETVRFISMHDLKMRVESGDADFVPHPEEYAMLFEYLIKK